MDREEFIEKSKQIWGEDKFDYSDVVYVNRTTPVILKYNGVTFSQAPKHHLEKRLPLCLSEKKRLTTKEFIEKAKQVHGNKYDYSKAEYINSHSKNIIVICHEKNSNGTEHGEFITNSTNHLCGCGCPKCKLNKLSKLFSSNTEEFIEKAKKIHRNENNEPKYDYSNVKYINNSTDVDIICPKHGIFKQTPGNHLKGENCPKCMSCGVSYMEEELYNYISSLDDSFETHNKKILDGFELDIYSDKLKIAFEFDGLYWHCELNKPKDYHLNKTELCAEKGIKLIHIFEDEWLYKQSIVKSRIKNILNKTDNIFYARKCEIRLLSNKEANDFLDDNHIQGKINSSINIGLFYKDNLLSVMTFGSLRKCLGREKKDNNYELLRFCNKINTSVVGGASKLFNFFIKKFEPHSVISYADRRWSNGNLYEKLNFNFINNTVPNYFYIKNKKRYNRYGFRKNILVEKYGCDNSDTEHNFCYQNGWYRIYDCGSKLYKWEN